MRAAIYLRVPTLEEARKHLDDYKEQAVKYCRDKGYDHLVVVEVVGTGATKYHFAHNQLQKLIRNHMIDVLVMPYLHMISHSVPDIIQMLDYLCEYGVKTECVRCDPMEYAILEMYRDTEESQEENWCGSPVSMEDLFARIARGQSI